MTRLLQSMLVLMELFIDEEQHCYKSKCLFILHSLVNLLVDLLQELNKLNINFCYDIVDITTISATIDITI